MNKKQLKKNREYKKQLRKNKEYRLEELEKNAIRRKVKGYDKDIQKIKQIKKLVKYYQDITGIGRKPRKWLREEIEYLTNNYKLTDFLTMALYLDRSWGAISHKLIKLKLKKNHKWT